MKEATAIIRRVHITEVPVQLVGGNNEELVHQAVQAASVLRDDPVSGSHQVETQVISVQGPQGQVFHSTSLTQTEPPRGGYLVVWQLAIPAGMAASPDDAAAIARIVQADPSSAAGTFHVVDSEGVGTDVNLQIPSVLH